MDELQKIRASKLLEIISDIENESSYLENKSKRLQLVSIYKQVTSFFKVSTVSDNLPKMLSKDVSETCSRCVRKEAMKGYIRSALSDIRNYELKLKGEFVEPIKQEKISVHDLRPTDDN